jgi:3-oxoadipate enol-lactonase
MAAMTPSVDPTGAGRRVRATLSSVPRTPALPPGRPLELPGRGTTFVRELPGPPGAPTVLLLHGWTATADLNWFPSYFTLGRRFRVVALDHRGHGRGIRSSRRFTLADCADDAAAAVRSLGIDRVIATGYSMGGPVAQLLWRRHHDLVAGLVLCATSRNFRGDPRERVWFSLLPGVAMAARVAPPGVRSRVADRFLSNRLDGSPLADWAVEELRRNDPLVLAQAGNAIGRFTSHEWIGQVDVPTAVVVTEQDSVVPPHRQRKLAASIPGATVHPVAGDHGVCVANPRRFVPVLLEACSSVAARASAGTVVPGG